MDWRNTITWTGKYAPRVLYSTDSDFYAIWVMRDGQRWTGLIEHHRKPVYPVTRDVRRYPLGRSYRTRGRLVHYAAKAVQAADGGA